MIYHPGHFHGISHEQDVQWLVNLPIAKAKLYGDGVTTHWRLKFECRKWAMLGTSWPNNSLPAKSGISLSHHVEIDEDSHYVNITPPLTDGMVYDFEYHYVEPL